MTTSFTSKVQSALVRYYDCLLEDPNVQLQIECIDPHTDLDDPKERMLMAVLMSETAPEYLKDYLDDTFLEIYMEQL
jgi:hypothetical protein